MGQGYGKKHEAGDGVNDSANAHFIGAVVGRRDVLKCTAAAVCSGFRQTFRPGPCTRGRTRLGGNNMMLCADPVGGETRRFLVGPAGGRPRSASVVIRRKDGGIVGT
jgi:secreted PhoX family phosphatase